MSDARQFAPATQRNRQPILEVLSRILPPQGMVLEIASGTGEHAVFFAPQLRPRLWQPSDPNPTLRDSIRAWQAFCPCDTLRAPLDIDTRAPLWPVESEPKELAEITALVCINMIHIAPWESCLGLLAGAGRILKPGGLLYLYGPFLQTGIPTAESNLAFDQSLRAQDPTWGIRSLEEVSRQALHHRLQLQEVVVMPANNLSVVFTLRS